MTVKERVGVVSSPAPPSVGRGRGRPSGPTAAVVGGASEPVAPPSTGDAVPEDREEGKDY